MLKEVDKKNIRVLYILGSGHSGSTLLDCILGNNPNVFSVGELSFYNVIKNHIPHAKTKHRKGDFCACGEKMSNCSFWKRIIKIDGNKFHIKKTYTKQENFNYLSQSSNLSRLKRGNFKNADFELLKLIASESGRSVILDSSKDPRRQEVLKKVLILIPRS